MRARYVALVCLVAATCRAGLASRPATEPAGTTTRPGDVVWQLTSQAAKDARATGDREWGVILFEQAALRFLDLGLEKDLDANARLFIDHFGQGSPLDDYAWLLATDHFAFPTNSKPIGATLRARAARPEESIRWRAMLLRDMHIAVCRAQVERMVADRKFLERFYWGVLWGGSMFRSGPDILAPRVINDLQEWGKGDADDYWLHARNFCLMAYVTGREDLLDKAKATELMEPYKRWAAWLEEKNVMGHLVLVDAGRRWAFDARSDMHEIPNLQIPDVPVPDWRGPAPIRLDDLQSGYYRLDTVVGKFQQVARSRYAGK